MSTDAYRAAVRRYIASSSEALRPQEYLDFHAPVVADAFAGDGDAIEDRVLAALPEATRQDFTVRYERVENCYRVMRLLDTDPRTRGAFADNPGIASPRQV